MQKKLSQWATEDPTKRFVDLYSLLCNETWLQAATHATLRNKGSETAGIDCMTKSNFPDSIALCGRGGHCASQASRSEDLQVEHPVWCGDASAFHFHATLA